MHQNKKSRITIFHKPRVFFLEPNDFIWSLRWKKMAISSLDFPNKPQIAICISQQCMWTPTITSSFPRKFSVTDKEQLLKKLVSSDCYQSTRKKLGARTFHRKVPEVYNTSRGVHELSNLNTMSQWWTCCIWHFMALSEIHLHYILLLPNWPTILKGSAEHYRLVYLLLNVICTSPIFPNLMMFLPAVQVNIFIISSSCSWPACFPCNR